MQLIKDSENLVDDLEAWLSVFNVKLTHMREDIRVIEARNNELELKARNSNSLLAALKEFLKTLSLPSSVEAALRNSDYEDSDELESIVKAANSLIEFRERLYSKALPPIAMHMKAVRQRIAFLENLVSLFTKRTTIFLKTLFDTITSEAFEAGIDKDKRGYPKVIG